MAGTAKVAAKNLVRAYLDARDHVIATGHGEIIDYYRSIRPLGDIDDERFLSNAAWCVLSGGMSEKIIRRIFPRFTDAFLAFRSAREIVADLDGCTRRAYEVLHNEPKIRAIGEICRWVAANGVDTIRAGLEAEGPEWLTRLPRIGKVTCWQLAKDLGLDCAKPDRHIARIAEKTGYGADVQRLCADISAVAGDSVAVVDAVLWRYATLDRDYLDAFPPAAAGQGPPRRG